LASPLKEKKPFPLQIFEDLLFDWVNQATNEGTLATPQAL
jgi:hypothetical protein